MTSLTNESRTEHDCLYGEIQLPDILSKIIDTPEFQRLRRIKQLGGVDYVFKDATHTRYQHCIGTAYLAGLIVKRIQDLDESLEISPIDRLCVQIAALCHDLGHGPLSYVFRGKVLRRLKLDPSKHKELACNVFERIWKRVVEEDPNVTQELGPEKVSFIKELIKGPANGQQIHFPQGHPKACLYEIFSNLNAPLDVCMFDYMARDCLHFGRLSSSFYDALKCLNKEALLTKEHGQFIVHSGLKKDYGSLRDMHTHVYQSSKVNAVEHMLCDAIVYADAKLKISKQYSNLDFFSELDDYLILGKIKGLENDDQKNGIGCAKAILKRIDNGDYYDLVSELTVKVCCTNADDLADALANRLATLGSGFDADSVRISVLREEARQGDPEMKTIHVFCANPKDRLGIHQACEILKNDLMGRSTATLFLL